MEEREHFGVEGGFGKEKWGPLLVKETQRRSCKTFICSNIPSSPDHLMPIECFLRVRASCTGSAFCRQIGGICTALVGDFCPRTHKRVRPHLASLANPSHQTSAKSVHSAEASSLGAVSRYHTCILVCVIQPGRIGNKNVGAIWVGFRSVLYICSIVRGNQVRGKSTQTWNVHWIADVSD